MTHLKRAAVFSFCLALSFAQQPELVNLAALKLLIVEGDGAINNLRQRLAREPIVEVRDENDRPVAGAVVTFTIPSQGPGATLSNGARFLAVTTDSQGRAVAAGLRPNGINGPFDIRVNATYQGRTARTAVHQSNVGLGAAAGGLTAKWLVILAAAGGAVAGGVVAATHGGSSSGPGSSSAPQPPQPTVITSGGTTAGPPR